MEFIQVLSWVTFVKSYWAHIEVIWSGSVIKESCYMYQVQFVPSERMYCAVLREATSRLRVAYRIAEVMFRVLWTRMPMAEFS